MFRRSLKSRSYGGRTIAPLLAHSQTMTAVLCTLLALGSGDISARRRNIPICSSMLTNWANSASSSRPSRGAPGSGTGQEDADSGNPVAAAVVWAITEDRVCGGRPAHTWCSKPRTGCPGGPARRLLGARGWRRRRFRPGGGALLGRRAAGRGGLPAATGDGCIKYHKGQPLTPNMSFVCRWRMA